MFDSLSKGDKPIEQTVLLRNTTALLTSVNAPKTVFVFYVQVIKLCSRCRNSDSVILYRNYGDEGPLNLTKE